MKIRGALYARRSTDEQQVESLDTQLDNGRRFALAKGVKLDPVHEYTDTASRAEFAPHRRPGFAALREAALAGQFEVLIVRDDSRLGGDMLRVASFAQEMTDAGVKILFYATGEEMVLDSETTRLLAVMRGFASESERRKISSRTRESAERKARRGLVPGGAVYGYRSAPSPDGMGRIRLIDEPQAAIVREIFERYAKGEGLRVIAKSLSERKVPAPRPGPNGLGAWAPSALHAMLRRPLYIGRIEWGHVHKTYKAGTQTRTKKHAFNLVVADAPHLRIIPEDLWNAVQTKIKSYGIPEKRGGRPASYLLSGILRCASCDGPLTVINGRGSAHRPIKVYACCRRRDRGGTVCLSTFRRDVNVVNNAVLDWVRREVLTDAYLSAILDEARKRIASRVSKRRGDLPQLERQIAKLRAEVDKFAELALEAPPAARAVFFAKVGDRQNELAALADRLRKAQTDPTTTEFELRRMERDAKRRLAELSALLDENPVKARALMRSLFPEGLQAKPSEARGKRHLYLEGLATPARAFGVVITDGNSAPGAGLEPAASPLTVE